MSTTIAVLLTVGGAGLALLAVMFGAGSADGDGSPVDTPEGGGGDSGAGGDGGGD